MRTKDQVLQTSPFLHLACTARTPAAFLYSVMRTHSGRHHGAMEEGRKNGHKLRILYNKSCIHMHTCIHTYCTCDATPILSSHDSAIFAAAKGKCHLFTMSSSQLCHCFRSQPAQAQRIPRRAASAVSTAFNALMRLASGNAAADTIYMHHHPSLCPRQRTLRNSKALQCTNQHLMRLSLA